MSLSDSLKALPPMGPRRRRGGAKGRRGSHVRLEKMLIFTIITINDIVKI